MMPGKAVVNINLLEPSGLVSVRVLRWGLGLFMLAIISLGVCYFMIIQSRQLKLLQADNLRLQAEANNNQAVMAWPQPLQVERQELTDIGPVLQNLEESRLSYVEIIDEIDRVIPPGVTIVEIELKPALVALTGFSADHSQVADLLEGLKESPEFGAVSLFKSEANGQTEEDQFRLEIVWEAETT
jgi:Tfp pilus assembly protein PilN